MRLFLLVLLNASGFCFAQSTVLGKWKTIDDASGEARSIVEIVEKDGKIYGKVIRIFPRPDKDPDPVCNKCQEDDPRFNKKIIGMEIVRNLKKNGEEYSGGDILDPENGRIYRSKVWVEGKDLRVRGYWGPFYRTQTWLRAD